MSLRVLIPTLLMLLMDLYFYQAVKTLIKNSSEKRQRVIINVYWGLAAVITITGIIGSIYSAQHWPKVVRVYFIGIAMVLFVSKLLGSLFLMGEDVGRGVRRGINKIRPKDTYDPSRKAFISKLTLSFAAIPFIGFMYGIVKSAFDFQIHRVKIPLANLPDSFNGLKIVQISDIHSGTFTSTAPLERAAAMIKKESADIVFFTGDLVNEIADEANDYLGVLSSLKAPMGVYSILGNHDYGDYYHWNSEQDKTDNLNKLKQHHKTAGWDLLLNESRIIEKNGEKLAIVGVENWGNALRFPKLGDIDKAKKGTEDAKCKLLLSHDPSHWEAKVVGQHNDLDVMFAGHTHGFQMGVEIPGFKWSPFKFIYKQWAGLYKEGGQYLYVNRGLGVIGYPGRLGILPEITVFELVKA